MLRVCVPATRSFEHEYVLEVLLRKWLGLDFEISIEERTDVRVTVGDDRALHVADPMLTMPEGAWLTPVSLPRTPLRRWHLPDWLRGATGLRELPVLYAAEPHDGPEITRTDDEIRLNVDVFGTAFFFLTRYEELTTPGRDARDRFPVERSLAEREQLLERPIVNEYLDVLWACLSRLWPALERLQRRYSVFLTHDVDQPLVALGLRPATVLRGLAGDLLRRRSPALALRRAAAPLSRALGKYATDPYNTYDLFMDAAQRQGLRCAFFFICGDQYPLSHPFVRDILRRIHTAGHEIGLHPGYGTYRDSTRLAAEFDLLTRTCAQLDIEQQSWGGRQHGLQWRCPTTWRLWDEAGLAYDSSVTFAARPGFRCGTCYPFPVFDLERRRALALVERPLIVMDTSLFAYLSLDLEAAADATLALARACKRHDGEFVGLWHNNTVITGAQQRWFRDLVGAIA